MAKTKNSGLQQAQNPLLLRSHRLMEAFAKSDDERDFYLDRVEGFIIYVDLDKPHPELTALERALKTTQERYVMIPKLSLYETKKIMEGFVNEKVYDIDTKEKLLDIIGSKSARENFLEFIYDHHSEFEKWQQYYQERSRIRIIEWLRKNHFQFVFEEDLDLPKNLIEKVKIGLFDKKVSKDVEAARKTLASKARTYYSTEALNPRPKRGRPPKQIAKQEVEPQVSSDIYTSVPSEIRPFLFTPDIGHASHVTFSSKFQSDEPLPTHRKINGQIEHISLESLNKKLEALRQLSSKTEMRVSKPQTSAPIARPAASAVSKSPVPIKTAPKPQKAAKKTAPVASPKAKVTPVDKKKSVVAKEKSSKPKLRPARKVIPRSQAKAVQSAKKVVSAPAKKGKAVKKLPARRRR